MKQLNSIKLASSFREISDTLDIVSGVIRLFVIGLMIIQGISLAKSVKKS